MKKKVRGGSGGGLGWEGQCGCEVIVKMKKVRGGPVRGGGQGGCERRIKVNVKMKKKSGGGGGGEEIRVDVNMKN